MRTACKKWSLHQSEYRGQGLDIALFTFCTVKTNLFYTHIAFQSDYRICTFWLSSYITITTQEENCDEIYNHLVASQPKE